MRLLLPILFGVAACGGSAPTSQPDAPPPPPPDADVAELTAIVVSPQARTMIVENQLPESYAFFAMGIFDDGSQRDIGDRVTWDSYDPSLVTVDGSGRATPSTQRAGETQVVARIGTTIGTSDVTVVQRRIVVGTGAPADAPDRFRDAAIDGTVGKAPGVIYPYTPTVIPPNFSGVEVHFLPGQGNNLFELTLAIGLYEYRHYAGCSPVTVGACQITPTADGWTEIAQRAKGADLDLYVAGLSTTSPGTKGVSSSHPLTLTSQDLTAGLYYWAATDGKIHRFDFGRAGVPPEVWYPDGPAGDNCAACHSLSRDGTLAAIDRGAGLYGLELVDVATRTLIWGSETTFARTAFSPDNTMLLSTSSAFGGPGLTVLDVATGADLGFTITDQPVDAPDWSPDGSMIAFVMFGALYIASWDGTSFGDPILVHASGDVMNPAFTPDSQWILFNKSSNLYAIRVDATPTTPPIPLGALNQGIDDATWCKVAPSMMAYAGGEVAFLTFSTRRPIGLRFPTDTNQIWFGAFDPARAAAGLDPSFPPIHLPWQATTHGNHIAQWATEVVHEPCGPMGECPPEFECQKGECVPIID